MEVTAALGNGFAFMRKNRMEDIIMKDAIEKWLSEDKISEWKENIDKPIHLGVYFNIAKLSDYITD